MSAPFIASPGGAYAESAARVTAPAADDAFIHVTVDGRHYRVYYEAGRPYWIRGVAPGNRVLCGMPIAECAEGGGHHTATVLAEQFLDGLREGTARRLDA